MKKVLVMMSTYNGEAFLKGQIDSIIHQIFPDGEIHILIRDDGSTDSTLEIVNQYLNTGQVELCNSEGNYGSAYSFLKLVQQADKDYDYYSFADQDDIWDFNKLQRAVKKLESASNNRNPSLYYSNARLCDSWGNLFKRNVYNAKQITDSFSAMCLCSAMGCTMVFNAALMKCVLPGQTPKKVIMHDSYMLMLCLAMGGIVVYDEQPSLSYRQHGNNVLGVATGLKKRVANNIRLLCEKPKISIADQAQSIIDIYNTSPILKILSLQKIARYRESIARRIGLAFFSGVSFPNSPIGIINRLRIIKGNL